MGVVHDNRYSPVLTRVIRPHHFNPRSPSTPSRNAVKFFDPHKKITDAACMELLSSPLNNIQQLMEAFFQNKSRGTVKAYRQDLQSFVKFLEVASVEEAARKLLSAGHGAANLLALQYKNHLREKKLSPASINRKLAALRSLVKLGRVVGLVSFSLEVDSVEARALRDTRGPGASGVEKILRYAEQKTDHKGKRDYAILRLLFDIALRRAEVSSIDVDHLDVDRRMVLVMGKGRQQRQWLSLPEETMEAIASWLKVRGEAPGPLLLALDPRSKGKRLGGDGVYQVVKQAGQSVGIRVRPHGLRHAAITEALNETGGDLRQVQQFSRHKSYDMLMIYDDARENFQGTVAQRVATKIRTTPRI